MPNPKRLYPKNKPFVAKPIPSKVLRHKKVFKFSIKKYFGPKNSSLEFLILSKAPSWLFIDSVTGVMSGIAPTVPHKQQFLMTVAAKNNHGQVSQTFAIKVINTEFFETITDGLIHNLSLRKRYYHFDNLNDIPKHHDLLEYIFEFIMNSDHREDAIKRLNDKAEELDIKNDKDMDYEKFKEIVKKAKPGIEAALAAELSETKIAVLSEINNMEFRDLFRQGAQLPGSIVPFVLNELGIADYMNISDHPQFGKNVLDAAGDKIIKNRQQAENLMKFEPKRRP